MPSIDEPFDASLFLAGQKNKPGVYQMFDSAGHILYVGKAKSLKKRLTHYFGKTIAGKTRSLVSRITRIEVTVTRTETEALLLEQSLIKEEHPPYNILLRDDKSYPYIYIATDTDYPRIDLLRGRGLRGRAAQGKQKDKGRYFGPYPSAASVRESLQFLQKTFRVRQCDDSFFSNRSRPCLQYQIHRCTAPCVKLISEEDYAKDVKHTLMFLEGKEDTVIQELANQMEAASAALAFEQAARYRDQISHLRHIQEPQAMEEGRNDADVMAVALQSGMACVQVITVRHGRVLGSRAYYPEFKLDNTAEEILAAFLLQYYLGYSDRPIPRDIIVSMALADEQVLVEEALSQASNRKVQISVNVRSHRARWQELAQRTAEQNILGRLANRQNMAQRFERLQEVLQLDSTPERIECYDVSHSSGEATVASCVVFDNKGPVKSDYRRFNIKEVAGGAVINSGDDYAAMKQALERRYTRAQQENEKLPDVLFVDGGKGQLSTARAVLRELQITSVQLVGVAKGSTRKAGFETLLCFDEVRDDYREFTLPGHDPALHLIQQIRDEAHRFAITGHKQRRDKARQTSRLESIPGIGAKRRRELLRFFGGQQEIARAGVEELARVPGINEALALAIYEAYRQ